MRQFCIISAVLMLAAGLSACGNPTYTYRYKLTIDYEVHGDLKSAFNVVEISKTNDWLGNLQTGTRGEALFIDLGPQPLIVLLSNNLHIPRLNRNGWGEIDPTVLLLTRFNGEAWEWDKNNRNLALGRMIKKRGGIEIQPADLPDLVTFTDINDPTSVEEVDRENPGAVLGGGFRFKRIFLEVTNERLTTGITKKLPWLEGLKGGYLEGGHYSSTNKLSNRLDVGSFKRGSHL